MREFPGRLAGMATPLAVALVLAGALLACSFALSHTLLLPWFWYTEEGPYAQEVLRFLSGNFRQEFFDIPGTPFIMAIALAFKATLIVLSMVGQSASPFDHLTLLYVIMRSLSAASFIAAGVLLFLAARQIASLWGAVLAALALVFHPIIAQTLTHTRIEPVVVFLVSASIFCWLRAIQTGRWSHYAAAGLAAGLAMAARFQVGIAALPVFLVFALARPVRYGEPKRIDNVLVAIALAIAVAGGTLAVLLTAGTVRQGAATDLLMLTAGTAVYPAASRVIARLWIVLGVVACVVILVRVFWPAMRDRYANSSLLTVAGWFPLGVVVGAPTLFLSGTFFLRSVEMFVTRNEYVPAYQDTWLKVVAIFTVGAPRSLISWAPVGEPGPLFSIPLVLLFAAALFNRRVDRALLWCVALGCVIGVASQFGKLQTSRHIAGWLPWFCLMAALGADAVVDRIVASQRVRTWAAAALAVVIASHMAWVSRAVAAHDVLALTERVPAQIELQRYAPTLSRDATVFYGCCSPSTSDMMTAWFQKNGISTDAPKLTNVEIWFGDLSSLKRAGDGYLVLRNRELTGMIDYYRSVLPNEVVDPEFDERFELVHSIPINSMAAFNIYRFSLTGEQRRLTGGIEVVEASYGLNCANATRPVRAGNVTPFVRRSCNRKTGCRYRIDVQVVGDPASFCAKDFSVRWRCDDGQDRTATVPPEAHNHDIELTCPPAGA